MDHSSSHHDSAFQDPLSRSGTEPPDCEALRALIPAYSIGATDPDEEAFIKAHLADCGATGLADYMALAEALHYSAPPAAAPARLLDSLMRRAVGAQPAQTAGLLIRRRHPQRMGIWRWAVQAAVILILLLATNILWYAQLERLRADQQAITARLEDQNRLLALVGAGTAQRVYVPAAQPVGLDDPQATLICDPERDLGLLYVKNFPELAEEMAYQIWLIRGDERVSGGLFRVDATGETTVVFRAPAPIGTFTAIGITPEPASGSAGPTAPPVVRGRLYEG